MPEAKISQNGNGKQIATWIMGALLAVLLVLATTILQGNALRLDRVEISVADRGERIAAVESRLGAIERKLDDVSGKLDELRMRR